MHDATPLSSSSGEARCDLLPIVTIDGPAGVGKTTLARNVADALAIPYLDTGAMFRTIAMKVGPEAGTIPAEILRECIAGFVFTLRGAGRASVLACNGRDIGNEIRTEEVGALASKVAAVPVVRQCLKAAQQALGARQALVVEGRDMGTEVFPKARCKFFLDASPEIRAMRRFLQLEQMGETPDLALLTEQIRQRDDQDRNRAVAPLRPAADAMIIDTSTLDIDAVFSEMIRLIRNNCPALMP